MSELEPMTSSSSRGGYTQNLSECTSADGLAAVIASCSPLALQGGSMEEAKGHKRTLFPVFEACEDTGDEDICEVESTTGAGGTGGGLGQHVEKKRRLSVEQVKSLEKNFELENKLEPDRKIQLAKELGLQPRQVAVWFQNRRARWKTKQLEKDYDLLKLEYDELNSNYKDLMQEKDKLEEELNLLKKQLASRGPETEQNAEEVGAGGREDDDEVNRFLPKISTSTTNCKVSTTAAAVMNYLKEGSSSSDSDASEVLEADSPLASRLSVVDELHKAIPASSISVCVTTSASASASATAAAAEALNFGDPPSAAAAAVAAVASSAASFFYFPTDFHQQQQHQRSSLLKVEDWGLEEQGAIIPWWD